ncbi:MAG: DUF5683 domain-containing protein [Tunicatimonas sp.]
MRGIPDSFLRCAASTSGMTLGVVVLLTLMLSASGLWAQETELDSLNEVMDSVQLDDRRVVGTNRPGDVAPADTVLIDMVAPEHSPRKAALLSAALPGLGQIYNKKYWKVPIIYGGFGIMSYLIIRYNDQYQVLRRARVAEDSGQREQNPLAGFQIPRYENRSALEQLVDAARRERDYTVILTMALYGLNIMDAIVDAHLIEFDVNPDLSFNLEPTAGSRLAYHHPGPSLPYAGLAFTVHIK